MDDKTLLFNSGVLVEPIPGATLPPEELWRNKKRGLVVVECPQRIPCNPCYTSCPTGAILAFEDINDTPQVDYEKCTGCAMCVAACPGLACFVVDRTWGGDNEAMVKLPWEFTPRPKKDALVQLLDRQGRSAGEGVVVRVTEPLKDRTCVVQVQISLDRIQDVRAIRLMRGENDPKE